MISIRNEQSILQGVTGLENQELLSVVDLLGREPIVFQPNCVKPEEELIVLSESRHLWLSPAYFAHGLAGARRDVLVRCAVESRLKTAASALPVGFALIVFDGWRSAELQRSIYHEIEKRSRHGEATRYAFNLDVDKESVPYPAEDAPHRTGGAVDVGLIGPDGLLWPMGTAFDSPVGDSATTALEGTEPTNLEEKAAQLGRRLLVKVMLEAGFSNYPEEWWHYDYGNAFWRHFGKLPPGPVYRTIDL